MKETPKNTVAAFKQFDEALNLDPAERKAAERRHRQVTECLVAVGLAVTTFLQGSFARKTMLKPLKDVDMVIVLPERLAAQLRRPGGAAHAIALVRQAISDSFPDARFDVSDTPAHALQVVFADLDFTFDLVPGYADPAGSEDVFIADREKDAWERSNTRTLNRIISERNQATDGRFVHQVRMDKSYKNDHQVLDETCGLLWESLAYGAITTKMSHSEAVAATLKHAASALTGAVYDPTGADDLTAEWTTKERVAYVAAVRAAAQRADEALRLEADGDHEAAIELWHDILGEPFPSVPPQSATAAWEGLTAGGVTGTGRAVRSPRANQPARPGRSWRSR
jgi:hypothetical protein